MKLVIDTFRKEVNAMKDLKHENLINILAANEKGTYLKEGRKMNIMYLAVELAENAELFDYVADSGYGFQENYARILFKQLIAGLSAMHEKSISHRDLKTENLFLNNKFQLKIGDFGFAKFMDIEELGGKLKTQLGTFGYQCPELVEGHLYDGKANDIFACGVILFILVNAYPPIKEAKKNDNWYRHFYSDKTEEFWNYHLKKNKNTKEFMELVTGMLKYKNRWTMSDILNCAWFKGDVPSNEEYLADMLRRKEKVDNRRKKDREEMLDTETYSSTSKLYRGENEDAIIKKLFRVLEDSEVNNFNINYWSGNYPKNYFRFKDTDIVQVYKYLIALIVNEQGTVDLLDKIEYNLFAEVPFISEELTVKGHEEANNAVVRFFANCYIDEDTRTTIVEVIKDGTSDYFEFVKLISHLSDIIKK